MVSMHIQLPAFHCQVYYTTDAETMLAHSFVEAVTDRYQHKNSKGRAFFKLHFSEQY